MTHYDEFDDNDEVDPYPEFERDPFRWVSKDIPEGNIKVKINSDNFKAASFTSKNGQQMQLILVPIIYEEKYRFDAGLVYGGIEEFAEKFNKGDEITIKVFFTPDGIKRANVEWWPGMSS
jgi:hypothetical protein